LCGACHDEWHAHYDAKVRFDDFLGTIPGHVWAIFAADPAYAGKTSSGCGREVMALADRRAWSQDRPREAGHPVALG
jgi:hypothetical protein